MADNYTNTGKMTEKQKVEEITEKLEQGIKEVFESEKYKSYLNTMSKFHTYSFNNTMLIAMQKPDATLVAGYKAWQKNFDRYVKKGEKGIRILAPTPYKIKEEQEKTDPETGELVLDKNGMPVIEEVEVKIPAFRVVPVFDVSQTDGKELPDIGVSELLGSVQDYEKFMQALTEISPVPISYEQIDGDSKGYFHISEHRIALQEETSQSHTIKTAVHEVAHAKLHDKELNSELEEGIQKDRSTKEVEAESIAYTVCQHFGIDTSDYSFGYIAGWSSGKDRKELKSSLDIIRKTASELITGISERLQELKMNRVEEQELLSIQRADQTSTMEKAEELLEETTQESVAETLESEKQTENRTNMENIETDKLSYYVIADISTWAENSSEKSKLERFDSLSEAIEKFSQYRADITNDSDERTRTTLGASINGREVDVAYAVRHENILSLDFTHSQTAQESKRFIEALQTLCVELPIDRVRVHRNMTSEEIKDFVKKHLVYQLKESGIEDNSFYMTRFDSLYEQGKMDNLLPTANQQHIVQDVPYTRWDNPYFQIDEPEQMAFAVSDKFICIQNGTDGYDYSIFNTDYKLLDGGIYDNPNISIHAALKAVIEDFKVTGGELISINYKELMEKTEAVEQAEMQEKIQEKQVVSDFKAKTNEMFHKVGGLDAEDMEMTVMAYIFSKIDEYNLDAEIVDLAVSGSRCRGLEQEGSDIDIVVEYKGSEKEDVVFHALHEESLKIGGVTVDINPITEGKTGTLAAYLPSVESYLERKRAEMEKVSDEVKKAPEKTVTLTVAECSEFHSRGEYYENIESVEEAIHIFDKIPSERRNEIPSIGIHIHTEGTESYEDVQMDIFFGDVVNLKMLDNVPDITNNPKAVAMIQELLDKLPDIEVRGSLKKWQAAFLAAEIDQLSYDYDPHQYKDTVENREVQLANITEDIENKNTEYLNDFLNAILAEEVRESITDIFGQGTKLDDSEAVQTARKAKELLNRLAEYKPLAKMEENDINGIEEQNYNMVNNTLNNGVEKKEKETEQSKGRISVREKLAEKKAMIEIWDKAEKNCSEKDTEKKAHREM